MWRRGGPIDLGIVSIWHVRGVTMVAHQLAAALECDDIRTHVLARWESDRFSNVPPVDHPRVTNGGQDPTVAATLDWATERGLDAVLFLEVHPNDWKRVAALRAAGVAVFATETLDLLRTDALPHYGQLDGMLHTAFRTAHVFQALHPEMRSLVVPWGIPPTPASEAGQAPASDGRRRFLHVSGWGGLAGRKNTGGILQAWLQAPPPNAKLVLHSQAPLDALGATMAAAARHHPSIETHEGTVRSLAATFAAADLVLCPSRREGIGLPQLEALAAGVPVLVSDGHLMTDWILPGEHAIVCTGREERDQMYLPLVDVAPETLSAAMTAAANEPRLLDAMRAHVERDRRLWQWTWQPAVARIELGRMIREPGYVPDPEWSYVPAWRRDFEARRTLSRAAR